MEYHNIETLDLRHSLEYRNTSRNVQAVDTKRDALGQTLEFIAPAARRTVFQHVSCT
jgi:hypothetical protein